MTNPKRILPKNARLVPGNAKKVFSGEIFDIYQWQQKMFDDSIATFEMAKRTDTVQIIGINADNVIVLDETQPDGTERFSSLPGGRVDDTDDSILKSAQREMLEETGYSFGNWKLLSVRQPQRKIEWFIYCFVAWDIISQQPQTIDGGEKITVKELNWKDFLKHGPKNTISENNLNQFANIQELINAEEYAGQ